ncbi:MAG: type 1 glutamine amidotransferase domain-containing protein [Planctomycetota bacterium]|jgi:protease I
MKAVILTADEVEDLELLVPYYRLREAGAEVDVAAPNLGPVRAKHGYTLDADLTFWDVDADAYDLVIIPGGRAPETVRLDEKAVAAVVKVLDAGMPVAAICHGAQVLISAGVLEGRRVTCWRGIRDDVRAAGAEYVDAEVVVDGNLITSRSPDDLPAFCREIMKAVEAAKRKTGKAA